MQTVAAIVAAGVPWVVACQEGETAAGLREGAGAFATNGFGDISPGGLAWLPPSSSRSC